MTEKNIPFCVMMNGVFDDEKMREILLMIVIEII
jgi:hypothetical protein